MKSKKLEELTANFKPTYQMGEEIKKEFLWKFLQNKYVEEDIIKNVSCFYINEYGMIESFPFNIYGDLNLNNPQSMINFIKIVHKYKKSIVFYRESTINNEVFNGRMFPYQNFILRINWNNSGNLTIDLKDITEDSIYYKHNINAIGQLFTINEMDLLDIFNKIT